MALMRQVHALGVAIKQPHADVGFQLLNGQRQRGLGNEHRLGGGGDRPGFRHRNEVANLA
ncbi:hypothetical protein D3C80_1819410 [compost metagenome]